MHKKLPSLEILRKNFVYDPNTGLLTANKQRHWTCPGEEVGWLNTRGDRVVRLGRDEFKVHRIVWFMHYGVEPGPMLDHINRIRTDNRIVNLREIDRAGNAQNAPSKIGVAGLRGIKPKGRKFEARIAVNGQRIALGTFDTKEEAHTAYIRAKQRMHIPSDCVLLDAFAEGK